MSRSSNDVLALVRFAPRDRIEQFAEGRLWLNSLAWFAKQEGDSLRSDPDEGVAIWLQPDRAELSVKEGDRWLKIPGISAPIASEEEATLNVNVFCMFALTLNHFRSGLASRVLKYGEMFAVLTDPDGFIDRVRVAAVSQGQELRHGLVEYVSEAAHHGPFGAFRKSDRFACESEFRLVLSPGIGRGQLLEIGPLHKLLVVGETSTFCERFALLPGGVPQLVHKNIPARKGV